MLEEHIRIITVRNKKFQFLIEIESFGKLESEIFDSLSECNESIEIFCTSLGISNKLELKDAFNGQFYFELYYDDNKYLTSNLFPSKYKRNKMLLYLNIK